MTALLGQSMAADWPTYPHRRKPTAMNALATLVQEAGELHPAGDGLVNVTYSNQQWRITVHVDLPEAFAHCDHMHDDYDGPLFGTITVTADTLDAAVTETTRRVADAIADTPATQIP